MYRALFVQLCNGTYGAKLRYRIALGASRIILPCPALTETRTSERPYPYLQPSAKCVVLEETSKGYDIPKTFKFGGSWAHA